MAHRTLKYKTPVTRMGGKAMLAPWLKGFIPEHITYCEPFAGGASLLFVKNPSKVEVLNDTDNYLIEFFSGIRKPAVCQQIKDYLEDMPYARTCWEQLRQKWKYCKPREYIPALAEWFYLNRLTFAGDQKHGGFAAPSVTGRNPAVTFRNTVNNLAHVSGRLQSVLFECQPFRKCIEKYDSPNTFFYIDPPYLQAERFYPGGFSIDDHFALAELLHGVKGKVMISHYDHPLYRDLYKSWRRHERQSFKGSHKSAGGTKPRTMECIWLNY